MGHDFIHECGENPAVNHTTVTLIARWWRELGLYNPSLSIEVEFESQPVWIVFAARKTAVGVVANQGVLLLRPSRIESLPSLLAFYFNSSSTFLWNAGITLV